MKAEGWVRLGGTKRLAPGWKSSHPTSLEFGTSRMRASPWLVPVLHARLTGINHAVRKVIAAALKAAAKV
jgi:hypothetical protein